VGTRLAFFPTTQRGLRKIIENKEKIRKKIIKPKKPQEKVSTRSNTDYY
jgi:hypothetical protein